MSAGISSTEGDEGRTLPEQISKAHSDSKSAEAKVQQASMKMKHLSKELKVCVLVDIFGLVFYPFDSRAKLL
jgi:structural maintenance of chromosome 2